MTYLILKAKLSIWVSALSPLLKSIQPKRILKKKKSPPRRIKCLRFGNILHCYPHWFSYPDPSLILDFILPCLGLYEVITLSQSLLIESLLSDQHYVMRGIQKDDNTAACYCIVKIYDHELMRLIFNQIHHTLYISMWTAPRLRKIIAPHSVMAQNTFRIHSRNFFSIDELNYIGCLWQPLGLFALRTEYLLQDKPKSFRTRTGKNRQMNGQFMSLVTFGQPRAAFPQTSFSVTESSLWV